MFVPSLSVNHICMYVFFSFVNIISPKHLICYSLHKSYPLHSQPDSAVIDPVSGDMYVGTHPVMYQYLKHLENPAKHTAPSQVSIPFFIFNFFFFFKDIGLLFDHML